jgi:hypothetical protein
MISDIVSFLKENGAYCPYPVTCPVAKPDRVMDADLPKEYKDFLLICDGFTWEGLVFFGQSGLADLEQKQNNKIQGQTIIGRSDDGLVFTYDKDKECYTVLDRASRDAFDSRSGFADFLKALIDEKYQDLKDLKQDC